MTNVRILRNSEYYVQSLNYGQTLQSNEPGITADLDPDLSYSALLTDQSSYGRIGHIRIVVSDEISDSRIQHFNGRGNVQVGDQVLILGFRLDRAMSIGIRGSGPSLSAFGLSGLLADPRVEVHGSAGLTAVQLSV